jgi:amidase
MRGWEELAAMDATEQAKLVRDRKVKPIELVEAAIARIERVNPQLNAVVTPMYEEARRRAQGELSGVLAGVPFLMKDLIAGYAGVPMLWGSRLLRGLVPTIDSELVVRLKRAGLVVLGKTNTPELGLLPTTESRLWGPCRNPWDPERTAGGSSGGSAAAVAAGLVPMAHGNDGGGSLRVPAACCGIFALKPTRGRTPLGPTRGDIMSGLIVEHAVTRSVRDSAALLDATAGPDLGDPYWAPPPERPFVEEVGADPGHLRIAFTTTPPTGVPVHPDCVAAVEAAARLAQALGHEVVEAAPVLEQDVLVHAFITVWSAGCAAMLEGLALAAGRRLLADEVEPFTWALYEVGRAQPAAAYLGAIASLQQVARVIARFFTAHDVWLTPTLAEPPLPLGSFEVGPDNPLAALMRAAAFIPFTPLANATGQPAMSVPIFWNAAGLPIGTHWMGRFGDEATLFRLAAQLEGARPWAHRRPPITA